jgi:prepilin peptidase CpaA
MPIGSVLLLLFPAGLLAAAVKDVTSFTIPNWLCAGLALGFAPAALAAGASLGLLGAHALVGAAALAAGFLLFMTGACGGGDAKLIAACALWLGWPALVPFLVWTAAAGGLIALGLLIARRTPLAACARGGPAWLGRLVSERDLPYGLAIAVGGLLAFPQSGLLGPLQVLLR